MRDSVLHSVNAGRRGRREYVYATGARSEIGLSMLVLGDGC